MYIKEIIEIDNLQYGEITKKFKPKEAKKLFRDGWIEDIDVTPPPSNSSKQTRNEIEGMIENMKNLSDEKKKIYINTDHDTSYYIKEYMSNEDLDWDIEDIEKIIDASKHIGRYYKIKFQRPRPRQVAEKLGIKYDYMETDTTDSPSYPSNHALQAKIVAHYYSSIYPEHKTNLHLNADKSAQGRVDAGVHYPSDKMCAYQIADQVMKYFKYTKLEEDAPMNATGSAVSTNVPVVRKKNKYEPSKLFDLIKKYSK